MSQILYQGIPIDNLALWRQPGLYLGLLGGVCSDTLLWVKNTLIKRFLVILLAGCIWFTLTSVPQLHVVKELVVFCGFWIGLGVASSIGLGTGLHTFVLYLGPHIAKIALISTSCGHIPQLLPNKWTFTHFGPCKESDEAIGFLGVLLAVQLQSFLWGFGTALGELPPYFIARKASITQKELKRHEKGKAASKVPEEGSEWLQQITALQTKEQKTIMDRAKLLIFKNLQKYGFLTVLLCASIPNPLFDLAGITCGHFLVPFKTFFGATFIGKAIIKVHIQMLFVIAIFRKQTIDWIVSLIAGVSQSLASATTGFLEKQRKVLHEPATFSDDKPLVARLWDLFILAMVAYFVYSIVHSQVQQKALQKARKIKNK